MPKIFVTVKANAKEDSVTAVDSAHFRVLVKSPPAEGRANQAVLKVLSEYFHCPKSKLEILSGAASKHKIIAIHE